jgi:hypothetical protein
MDQDQEKLASLIISIIILIIVIVLIVIVCCNWNTINNTTQPVMQNINIKNPQAAALAAAAIYKQNQERNAINAVPNNPQKAALGAGAYAYKQNQKNNFEQCGWGDMENGSVQCCGQPDGQGCTYNQAGGQCYAGYCQANVHCIAPEKSGICITHQCIGNTGDICARYIIDGLTAGWCENQNPSANSCKEL